MRFSVIVATYDRRMALRRCLAALSNQTLPACEIVVVDDASTDGTGAMVQAEFPRVRYLRQGENRGPAAARNRGVAVATGDVLAFTDDDCEPPEAWLSSLREGLERFPEAGAVGGVQEPAGAHGRESVLARYERFVTRRIHGLGGGVVVGRPAPVGTNNLAIRTELFRRLGGFDESFPVAGGEDADLLRRLADAGYETVALPFEVSHHGTYTWSGFLRQQVRRGVGAAHFQDKRGGLSPLSREVARLLATPVLLVRHLVRFRSPAMGFVRTVSGACQVWGRLLARRHLGRRERAE